MHSYLRSSAKYKCHRTSYLIFSYFKLISEKLYYTNWWLYSRFMRKSHRILLPSSPRNCARNRVIVDCRYRLEIESSFFRKGQPVTIKRSPCSANSYEKHTALKLRIHRLVWSNGIIITTEYVPDSCRSDCERGCCCKLWKQRRTYH